MIVAAYPSGWNIHFADMAELDSIEALFDKLPEEDQAHVKRLFYGGTGAQHK